MLRIVGQTARPIGLQFFLWTLIIGCGGVYRLNNQFLKKTIFFQKVFQCFLFYLFIVQKFTNMYFFCRIRQIFKKLFHSEFTKKTPSPSLKKNEKIEK